MMSTDDDENEKSPEAVARPDGPVADEEADAGTPAAAPTDQTPHQTSPAAIVEATKAWSQVAKSFMFVEVASLVLMFSCIGAWGPGRSHELAYALSVSVISLAACLAIQTGEFLRPGLLEKVERPVSLSLFVWWVVGTGVITFRAPFPVVGNGYFSSWAGLGFTGHWALNIDIEKFNQLDKGRKILFGFILLSAVLMFACIPFLISGAFIGQSAWGLSAGVISLVVGVTLFKLHDDVDARVSKILAVVLFAMWAVVAGVCTFDGPFRLAGNGYFASWGGFLLSTFYLQHIMGREDEII